MRIHDFPNYSISSYGRIINDVKEWPVRQSRTVRGSVKVGLYRDDKQHTRLVSKLVAETFVDGRTEIFDTPIHLDGDRTNNRADNLLWRPRNFAWKYSQQFEKSMTGHRVGPIREIGTSHIYENIIEVATTHGLLFKDVWRSIQMKEPTFPYKQQFEIIRN